MSDERTYKMLLSDIAGGGSGGGLPDYSEANDGDVLTIDNGEPAWAAPGGGSSNILLVTNDDGVLDKTWQEIYDAMDSSVLCVAVLKLSSESSVNITFNLIQTVLLEEGSYKLFFDDGSLFIASTANDYPILD